MMRNGIVFEDIDEYGYRDDRGGAVLAMLA